SRWIKNYKKRLCESGGRFFLLLMIFQLIFGWVDGILILTNTLQLRAAVFGNIARITEKSFLFPCQRVEGKAPVHSKFLKRYL
ncbi:MAG: hypothetical protein IJO75_00420, partial [Clostridia bacterium]|nr:hypothetical protein [Clostridia bacterium]